MPYPGRTSEEQAGRTIAGDVRSYLGRRGCDGELIVEGFLFNRLVILAANLERRQLQHPTATLNLTPTFPSQPCRLCNSDWKKNTK
jgi:hypothetical protein